MKPYVYIIQNLEKTHWYIGMRSANKCTANEDTGYWGSSSYLDELIKQTGKDQWTKTIIKEFDTKHDANEFEQLMIEFMWDWTGRVNKNINGYVDHSDPEVKAKHRAGIEKAMTDPEVKANYQAAAQKRAQDPVWQANNRAAAQKRSEDPVWQAKHKVAGQKRAKPFIATSITTGEEYYCESSRCEQVKALELNSSAVSSCLNGKYKQHKGFTFRYT